MSATHQRGEPRSMMLPVALATEISQGDAIFLINGNATPAESLTWDTNANTTLAANDGNFVGIAMQDKDAAKEVYGNGEAGKLQIRVACSGVIAGTCADGTYAALDLVTLKKDTGNNVLSQTWEKTSNETVALGKVVGRYGVNPGKIDIEILSRKASPAPQA